MSEFDYEIEGQMNILDFTDDICKLTKKRECNLHLRREHCSSKQVSCCISCKFKLCPDRCSRVKEVEHGREA